MLYEITGGRKDTPAYTGRLSRVKRVRRMALKKDKNKILYFLFKELARFFSQSLLSSVTEFATFCLQSLIAICVLFFSGDSYAT